MKFVEISSLEMEILLKLTKKNWNFMEISQKIHDFLSKFEETIPFATQNLLRIFHSFPRGHNVSLWFGKKSHKSV